MSCSISAVDSVEGSPVSATALMSECSTAAVPSGAATGSAGETVTAAGSPDAGGVIVVSCASTAAGTFCSGCTVEVIVSGACVAAVAACPAEISAPGFSLSENILTASTRYCHAPRKKIPGYFPVTGQVQGRECGDPPGPHRWG